MMVKRFRYVLLLASLPRHAADFFSIKQTPISRMQMDRRLELLDARDADDLKRIEALLQWSLYKDETDETIVKKNQELINLFTDDFLKEFVQWHLELATLMSALRRRHAGTAAPGKNGFPGFGEWPSYIECNWNRSDFGIGHRLPWITEAQALLTQNKLFELEKLLLTQVWRYYARVGSQCYFDFRAVVIYVLRWGLINRWLNYNGDKAVQRFDELVDAALAGFEPDFP